MTGLGKWWPLRGRISLLVLHLALFNFPLQIVWLAESRYGPLWPSWERVGYIATGIFGLLARLTFPGWAIGFFGASVSLLGIFWARKWHSVIWMVDAFMVAVSSWWAAKFYFTFLA